MDFRSMPDCHPLALAAGDILSREQAARISVCDLLPDDLAIAPALAGSYRVVHARQYFRWWNRQVDDFKRARQLERQLERQAARKLWRGLGRPFVRTCALLWRVFRSYLRMFS